MTDSKVVEFFLPSELWAIIANFSNHNEIAQFRQVSKLFNDIGLDSIYNRLFAFNKTLSANLQAAAKEAGKSPSLFLKEAFEKIQTMQQEEIAYLKLHTTIIKEPKYAEVLQQNTSLSLKSLEVNNAVLDAVNSEIITACIDMSITKLDLRQKYITRIPVALFKAEPYIKFWQDLTVLKCSKNRIISLSVQELVALEVLNCSENQLIELNLQGLVALEALNCSQNQLIELNLQGLVALKSLNFHANQLTALNVTGLNNLKILYFPDNQLTELEIEDLLELEELNCTENKFTKLNIKGLVKLQRLACDNNLLTELEVQESVALQELYCSGNHITKLDLQQLKALEFLSCSNNQLIYFNVQGLEMLRELDCSDNKLTALDLQRLRMLESLNLDNNPLVYLNLTDVPEGIRTQHEELLRSLTLSARPSLATYLPFSGASNNTPNPQLKRSRDEEQNNNDQMNQEEESSDKPEAKRSKKS